MGSITTGIGLISGINTAEIIEQLMALESRGKIQLQQRAAKLSSQKTALLDINARLLAFQSAAGDFRADKIFGSALATSSNEAVMTASAAAGTIPGNYQFIVKQMVSSHQVMSKGYANATGPAGLGDMTFEFGKGSITTDSALENLNGGNGVSRGKIEITDRAGEKAVIDLSDATTINEVLDRINSNEAISVEASISGDGLVITDTTGLGSGTLTVKDLAAYQTAADLGIAGSSSDGVIEGAQIAHLGASTALSSLRDGNGVLIRDNNPDIRITARDGTVFEVDFGRNDAPITNDTKLSALNNGSGVTISDDDENPDIKFIARDGSEHEVNLTGVTTVGQLINRIEDETDGTIQLGVSEDNEFVVTDNSGGTGPLKILGAGINAAQTANNLGILNVDGVGADTYTGSTIKNKDFTPAASTIGEIIGRINDAQAANGTPNAGRIVASVADDGVSLQISDTTGGTGNLSVEATAANPHAASHLGIFTGPDGVADATVEGSRIIAGLNTVLTQSLNGGSGLGEATSMTVQDRAGNSFTFNDLADFADASLSELLEHLNTTLEGNGVAVSFSVNEAGNGLAATDTSGSTAGNLMISGDGADALRVAADVDADTVRGDSLQMQYVSNATSLSALNFGRGVGTGSFRIFDGAGQSVQVNIDQNIDNVHELLQEINSRTDTFDVSVEARINDNGDGIELVNTGSGGLIKVENVNGTVARDLRLLGTADADGGSINGSQELHVEVEASDTLNDILSRINSIDNAPINVSLLNSGSGSTPVHLTFNSQIEGSKGRMLIDSGDIDLDLTQLSAARDAKVFYGSDDPATSVLITSSSNTVKDVVPGLTLNLKSASDEPVTISVARDTEKVLEGVNKFVESFNEIIDRINFHDRFDLDTEERGVLLGNPTVAQVRQQLYRTLQSKAVGVSTQYQYLTEVGIKIGTEGKIAFDEEKFNNAYAADPEAVENLFAAFEQADTPDVEEIAPGVTVPVQNDAEFISLGFGDRFKQLVESMTNSIDGTITRAEEVFDSRLEDINDQIERFDERLEVKRARLERQFAAMEAALSAFQQQGQALQSLQSNVQLSQSLLGS